MDWIWGAIYCTLIFGCLALCFACRWYVGKLRERDESIARLLSTRVSVTRGGVTLVNVDFRHLLYESDLRGWDRDQVGIEVSW